MIRVVLPAPFLSDESDRLARRDVEAHVPQGPAVVRLDRDARALLRRLGDRVAEPDPLEADPVARVRRRGRRLSRRLVRRDREVLEQVRHGERVLVDPADRREHRLERLLSLPERNEVERHVPESDPLGRRGERDSRVAGVERPRAEEREDDREDGAAEREAPVLAEELLAQVLVAIEEETPEAEELDLLHVRVVREDVLEVVDLARLGRAPVLQAKGGAREPHLRDRRRDRRSEEREGREAAVAHDQGEVARERESVLDELEALGHHRDRPVRGVAASAGQAVVEAPVLEVAQLEGERLLEDRDVQVEREPLAEELAEEAEPALGEDLRADDRELDQDPAKGRVTRAGDDGVDDLLARVRDREREERDADRERPEHERRPGRRPPDEAEGPRGELRPLADLREREWLLLRRAGRGRRHLDLERRRGGAIPGRGYWIETVYQVWPVAVVGVEVALIEKVKLPEVVGVPEMVSVVVVLPERARPGGRAPEETVHVIGAEAPVPLQVTVAV